MENYYKEQERRDAKTLAELDRQVKVLNEVKQGLERMNKILEDF